MNKYVILFKGINVGGKNLIKMKDLVAFLESKSFKDTKTYIQSGNVVLQSDSKPSLDLQIEVNKKFNINTNILVLNAKEFKTAYTENPYTGKPGKDCHIIFCDRKPIPDIDLINSLIKPSEMYTIKNKVLYLYAPDGLGRSKFFSNIDKCFKTSITTARNINTISKLIEMLG